MNPASQAETIARIAVGLPEQPTSGDVLRAISQAWNAGERFGFERGFLAHAEQTRMLQEAIERVCG